MHINLRKSNTDMLANIMSGQFSFPSPFWDHVSEEAKVSRWAYPYSPLPYSVPHTW